MTAPVKHGLVVKHAFNPEEHQHQRYDPLRGDWILVSPHRNNRPWAGHVEKLVEEDVPEFDPKNPLCPGVKRDCGKVNPPYTSTFVFTNDFPALLDEAPTPIRSPDPLFQIRGAKGTCKVMCFHPKTNVTIPLMTVGEIVAIIEKWIEETTVLGKRYQWVQIFENKGAIMGCSNPHPHCQIWASAFLPNEAVRKDEKQKEYFTKNGRQMLMDYVKREIEAEVRVVVDNAHWAAVVPYWAAWPFETMLLPKSHVRRFPDLNSEMRNSLASIMKTLTTKYDNLFKTNFPYTMGWHGAPTGPNADKGDHWVFHGMYLPPLLRSATIKKFMVGYELLAQCQRDLTPEKAAEMLRETSELHYKIEGKVKMPAKRKSVAHTKRKSEAHPKGD